MVMQDADETIDMDDNFEAIDSEVEDATAAVPIYTINSYPTDPYA